MSVSDLQQRRSVRRRRQTRRRRTAVLVAAVLVVLAVVAVWLVGFSSVLGLRQVQVTGTSVLDQDAVTRTAAVPTGTPLLRISEQQVADRVATLPPVEEVHVERAWPHDLRIAITERTPKLTISRAGRWALVDRQGIAFAEVADRPKDLLETRTELIAPNQLAAAASISGAMAPELAGQVDHLEMTGPDSIKAVVKGDREIFFGSGEQAEVKTQVAAALLKSTKAGHIDVSAPGHPSTR